LGLVPELLITRTPNFAETVKLLLPVDLYTAEETGSNAETIPAFIETLLVPAPLTGGPVATDSSLSSMDWALSRTEISIRAAAKVNIRIDLI
jgi:hypothetical protein